MVQRQHEPSGRILSPRVEGIASEIGVEDINLLEGPSGQTGLRNMKGKQKEKRERFREIIATQNAIKDRLSDRNSSELFKIMEKNRKEAKAITRNTTTPIDRANLDLTKGRAAALKTYPTRS